MERKKWTKRNAAKHEEMMDENKKSLILASKQTIAFETKFM